MEKFVQVFIKTKYGAIDRKWTYKIPDFLQENIFPGQRVLVPFGKGNVPTLAMVLAYTDADESDFQAKEILDYIDPEPILTKDLIDLGIFMHNTYLIGLSKTFMPLMPPGDFKEIWHEISPADGWETDEEVKHILKGKSMLIKFSELGQEKAQIKRLIKEKKLKSKIVVKSKNTFKYEKYLKLTSDISKEIKDLKLTDTQEKVIDLLRKEEISRKDLMTRLGISQSPINSLEKKGLIQLYDKKILRTGKKDYENEKRFPLNIEQIRAIDGIKNSPKSINLLKGITGSGKTEVYLRLTEDVVKRGGQVIVLVPEISLTPQMIERFKKRFGNKVSVMHSKMSKGARFDEWSRIKSSEVSVLVGVRSGIFAPFENLQLIIIDEEHDSSYRQHSSLKYDTYEVAKKRIEILGGKLLIGSATPSVERYYEALNGKIGLFELNSRAGLQAKLPEVRLINMTQELFAGNTSIFSRELRFKLEDNFNSGNQSILFLNRRGYSNFVSCRECGYVVKCDSCDISMSYHKTIGRLRCHYCGKTKPLPKVCPSCGSKYIKSFGVGTQQVQEEVKKILPAAKILRVDRDTVGAGDFFDKSFEDFKSGAYDIMIGTQMVAKGHDFPNVTLVGVVAADLSLYVSDFRAHEQTFQLLTQVSGRAGRGRKSGEVIIQTYSPDDYSIKASADTDYEEFFEKEINIRKLYDYPPFSAIFTISFAKDEPINLENIALQVLSEIGQEIKGFKTSYTKVIDMPKIKDVYKVKFQLKCKRENSDMLLSIIKRVKERNEDNLANEKIYIDVEYD